MTSTVLQILTDALRLVGESAAPGRGITNEQRDEALLFLNRMLDSWNTLKNNVFSINIARYTLSPSQTSYTIGPTGDFVAARPVRIENANIVLTNSSQEVRVPLQLLDADQWANISVQEIPTTIPVALYNDYDSPNSRLYLWGYPTQANDLELYTWDALPNSLAYTDSLTLPDGYLRAVVYNLAKEIAPLYIKKANPLLALITKTAAEARSWVNSQNAGAPLLSNDAAFMNNDSNRPYFNWKVGS